jgi:outer membrane protein TolC
VAQQAQPVAAAPAVAELQLSVEEALRLAEQRSDEVAIAQATVGRARGERLRALSEFLPQLYGSGSYDRLLRSEFDGLFDTEGSELPGEFGELPFGQKNTWRLGLALSFNLFAGGRSVAHQALAKAATRAADMSVASARALTVLEAASSYYNAVLADKLLAIAEATQKQAEDTLAQVREGRRVGARPEFDQLRAQVTVENQRPIVLQARVDKNLAYLRLKQQLKVPLNTPLVLTTSIGGDELAPIAPIAREVAQAPEAAQDAERLSVRQVAEAVSIRKSSVSMVRSQHFPQLNFVSNYGLVNYPEHFVPPMGEWRTNWTIGLTLQIPLFTGFRISGDVAAAEADLAETRARLRQTEELTRLDTENAREQLLAAEAALKASAGTVEQAQRAYEIADIRYREGISTQLELSDARILLQQAQANRARAARDVQVARIRVALLPHLPVGAAPSQTASVPAAMDTSASSSQATSGQSAAQGQPASGAGGASAAGAF